MENVESYAPGALGRPSPLEALGAAVDGRAHEGAREAVGSTGRPAGPAARRQTPLVLGRNLRPIVFGGGSAKPNVFAGGVEGPALVLSVHAADGELLGYTVVSRAEAGSTWGGMTISDRLSLGDALLLSRATALQLDLFGLGRGAHHCLVVTPAGSTARARRAQARAFSAALAPLFDAGLCTITHTSDPDSLQPPATRNALVASLAAVTTAALAHLGRDAASATVAVHEPSPLTRAALPALTERGLRVLVEGDGAWTAGADIVVTGAPVCSLTVEEARAVRAKAVVATGAVAAAPAAENLLHERHIVFVPDALAGAGAVVAAALGVDGVRGRAVLEATFDIVRAELAQLLERTLAEGRPLAELVRTATASR